MKKVLFTLGIILSTIMFTDAQSTITVSGTVTNSVNNQLAPNVRVSISIYDSINSFYFQQNYYTDNNGNYSATIHNYPMGAVVNITAFGYSNYYTHQTLVSSPFIANFIICVPSAAFVVYSDTSNPLKLEFYNLSVGNDSAWLWDFGDSATTSSKNTNHTYAQTGTYIVTLTANFTTSQSIFIDTIIITGSITSCQPNFTANPDSTQNFLVHFSNTSSGNPTSWIWKFGDNTISTLENPSHTYQSTSTKNVTLYVGGTFFLHNITKSVTPPYYNSCQANFSISPDSANAYLIHFHNLSTGTPTSYNWDFGDGTTSTLEHPSHTFTQSGIYNVTLSIAQIGCQSSITNTITAGGTPSSSFIFGQVLAGSNFADNGLVYLINYDSITNLLTAIDTSIIDSGAYYEFKNVPFGTYYIKAALDTTSSYYNSYFPTYYGNELLWSNATTVNLNAATAVCNINLISGSNPGGPGFIGGNVLQGANKGPGDPVGNVRVMLLDMSDNPIAIDLTDANGDYGFSSLAYGTYKVWIDIAGKTTIPAVVTINASSPSITNLSIIINSTTIISGFEKSPSNFDSNVSDVYPNPSFGNSKIKVYLTETAQINFFIFNSVGQLICSNTLVLSTGKSIIDIPGSELNNGIYTVRIESDKGQVIRKFVKVSK